MKCPYCGNAETSVVDSRDAEGEEKTRRRRECKTCEKRFTTYEEAAMELFVIKKSGRRAPFDRKKIKNGIEHACFKRPVSEDKIDSLVDEVERELRSRDVSEVSSRDIGELVMDKLRDVDDVAYINYASVYRQFRDLTQLEREIKALKVIREEADGEAKDSTDFMQLIVESPTAGTAQPWDRTRITDALVKETGIAQNEAEDISLAVERRVSVSGIKSISVSLLRELVNNELFERGHKKKLSKQEILGIAVYNLNQLIFAKTNENSNIMTNNPEAVNLAIAETTLKQYALKEVFSREVAEAHLSGAVYLHDLGYIIRVYSFHKDECVLAKINGRVCVRSFEQLWNEFASVQIVKENGFEIKPLAHLDASVYDKNKKWTKLKRVVRHESKKKMLAFESENGKSVIVTEDHPFITLPEKIPAYACPKCGATTSKTNGSNAPGSKTFLCGRCGKQFRKRCVTHDLNETVVKPAAEITVSDFVIESDAIDRHPAAKEKVFTPISEDLAYLIGLYVSEGSLGEGCVEISGRDHVERVEKIIKPLGFNYEKKSDRIRVWSAPLKNFLLELGCGKGSENKALPKNFLDYDDAIVDAMVAGVFDGDGTAKNSDYGGTEYSLRMTSRLLLSQIKHWLEYRRVKNSLTYIGLTEAKNYRGTIIENKKPLHRLAFYLNAENAGLLKKSVRNKGNKNVVLTKKTAFHAEREHAPAKIRAIKECIYKNKHVYDITTESGTFVCNGVVVHNCSGHSPEYIKKYGLQLKNLASHSYPAKHAATLTGHLNTFLASMQAYYAGALGLAYLNIFYAPLFRGASYEEMKQHAQHLIFAFSQNAFSRGSQTLFIDCNIHFGIPDYLKNVPAVGPGGKYRWVHANGETELLDDVPRDAQTNLVQPTNDGRILTYADYEREAQQFTRALLEVAKKGDSEGKPFAFPKLNCHVDAGTFADPAQDELLRYACEVSAANGSPYFVFDRDSATLSQCCRLKTKIEDPWLLNHPESIRFCGFQNITINLPQAAYRAAQASEKVGAKPTVESVIREVDWAMDIAMKAHVQKKKFIQKIMAGPGTPLWTVAAPAADGLPYLDLEKASYIIGMIGLNECVKAVTGQALHESDAAFRTGVKIISGMYLKAKALEAENKMKVVLEETPAESASLRLARIDLQRFPEYAKPLVRGSIETGEVYYTNSIHLQADAPVDIIERIEKQAVFNNLIEAGCITHVFLGEQQPSPESVYALVRRTWENTQSAQIVVSPEFTVCNDCGDVSRGFNRDGDGREAQTQAKQATQTTQGKAPTTNATTATAAMQAASSTANAQAKGDVIFEKIAK